MPLVRPGGRALTLAFGSVLLTACAAAPPPVFQPPADTPSAPEPLRDARAATGPTVSGRLLAEDGRQLTGAAIVLSPMDGGAPPSSGPEDAHLGPDGTFEFRNVPPGRYQIRARGQTRPSGPQLYATFGITVAERDLTRIDMTLAPGSRVSGQVVVAAAGAREPPAFDGLRVRAPFADGSSFGEAVSGSVAADGAFVISGLMSGRHVIRLEGLQPPWVLASVSHRGRDITDAGFEVRPRQPLQDVRVTLTDVASELSGLVLDGAGVGVPGAVVVAIPPSAQFWSPTSRRLAVTRTGEEGRYRIHGLPPGEYRLTASRDLDPRGLHEPGVLPALLASGGVPVTIRGPEAREIDLRLASSIEGPAAAAR